MKSEDYKVLVTQGYDLIAQRYLAWALPSPTRAKYVQETCQRLPSGATVLELGCGAGVPVAQQLTQAAQVLGVDISATQIALAREHVPRATFLHADMMQLHFPAGSFDAVVSFNAITHIPRAEHAALLERIAHWLKPHGVFTASLGAKDTPGAVEADWLGAPMFFSHFDAAHNRSLVQQAGLHLVRAEVIAEEEDGVPVSFLWILAQKPES
jgi:cyclopropane fatty-acyl-phospholipid synthase-like methyltransferase